MIPFNKPYFSGNEGSYILQAVNSGKISGDGLFTHKCHQYFEDKYGIKKALLTSSCTDALEMAAILLDIKEGDEIIAPAYTFVSTVNAFVLRGAKIVFVDSSSENPNIDINLIEQAISGRTKAIVVVHYAGIACDLDAVLSLAVKYDLKVIEDAAQAVDSFYKNRPLGTIGDIGTFSFHETKNIISGEGGLISINNQSYIARAEIIREKGTNRSSFFRGEVDKYGWVDIGSSFLPSDLTAAFLFAQLERMSDIQAKRKLLWNVYNERLKIIERNGRIKLPTIPEYAVNNAHMFYIVLESLEQRTQLIAFLKSKGVMAVFHYLSLHKSHFYKGKYDGPDLVYSDQYSDCLLRLPLYYELKEEQVEKICDLVKSFFGESK